MLQLVPLQSGRIRGLYGGRFRGLSRPFRTVLRFFLRRIEFDERWAYSSTTGLLYGAYRDLDNFLGAQLGGDEVGKHERIERVLTQLPAFLAHIRIGQADAYNDFNRGMAEAELRLNSAIPLSLLTPLLMEPLGWWAWLFLVGAILLGTQAAGAYYGARSQLIYGFMAHAAGDDALSTYVKDVIDRAVSVDAS